MKGQTCKDLVPGFEIMDKAGHDRCIPATDLETWHEIIIRITATQLAPPDK